MSYDQAKVDFSPEEHAAAAQADAVYEEIKAALADGAQLSDVSILPKLFSPTAELYKYLASEDRAEFAAKLMALAVMLQRDNAFL